LPEAGVVLLRSEEWLAEQTFFLEQRQPVLGQEIFVEFMLKLPSSRNLADEGLDARRRRHHRDVPSSLEQRRIAFLQGRSEAPHHHIEGACELFAKLLVNTKALVEMPLVRRTVYVAKRLPAHDDICVGTQAEPVADALDLSLVVHSRLQLPGNPLEHIVVVAE
jgi:hypothetical protein